MLFAYLAPESFLPLTSVLAAVVGGALMLGGRVKLVLTYVLRRATRKVLGTGPEGPHAPRQGGRAGWLSAGPIDRGQSGSGQGDPK